MNVYKQKGRTSAIRNGMEWNGIGWNFMSQFSLL